MSTSSASQQQPTITFVTGNQNKLLEVQHILQQSLPTLHLQHTSLELPEIQGTVTEVATHKIQHALQHLNSTCMVEDTSLCFTALGDLPGPYIKYFLQSLGHSGLNKMLDGFADGQIDDDELAHRRAYAQCIFTISKPSADPSTPPQSHLFVGRCYGHIVQPRGSTHFGWDAVFQPTVDGLEDSDPGTETFGEMSKERKAVISHRSRALQKLKEFLERNPEYAVSR